MPRRIRRNREHEADYKALKEGEQGTFETYKDILMMAACIGFRDGRRESFSSSAEPIEWDVFSESIDLPIVNAMALLETEDPNVLLSDDATMDRKFTILEEYANGGFDTLKRRILESRLDPLDALIELIFEAEDDDGDSSVERTIEALL